MSIIELSGLISGIIAIVHASLQLYEAVDDISGLPQSFRDVADRLPTIQHTLEVALECLVEEEADALSAERCAALSRMLRSCRDKATALQKIIQKVIPGTSTSFIRRCARAIKAISSADTVDSLMRGILGDLQVLTANRAVNAASRSQISRYITSMGRGEIPGVDNNGGIQQ